MNKEYILYLYSLTDLEEFVAEVKNIKSDVDASYGNKVVDAKSFLGVLGLSTRPVSVKINSDDKEEIRYFGQICKKYQ